MKRFLGLFLLLSLVVCNYSLAEEYIPQWEDLPTVDKEYAKPDLQYIQNNTWVHKHPNLAGLTRLSIVGIPFIWKTDNENAAIENNNRWYEEKQKFEAERDLCKNQKDDNLRQDCYLRFRNEYISRITSEKQTAALNNYARSIDQNTYEINTAIRQKQTQDRAEAIHYRRLYRENSN